METTKCNMQPLVAIRTLVYNHEPYLRDYFEGIVAQKTNFPFIAVVHDDCSTDGSAAIIQEYAEKYPEIVKPIFEEVNCYQNGTWSEAERKIAEACKNAKHIAYCEGDDYWTDPRKLQKQVDYMEAHPDCTLCFHAVQYLLNDSGSIIEESVPDYPGKSTIQDLAKGNYVHTMSVLYRNDKEITQKKISLGDVMPSDYVTWMLCAEKGYLYKIPDVMAVYRVGSGMWSKSHSLKNDLLYLSTLNKLYVAIEDKDAKEKIQQQIDKIIAAELYLEKDLKTIRNSKAYHLGKAILKPFKWFKK